MKKNTHLYTTCKLGKQSKCCRFLTLDGEGFKCLKLTSLRSTLDRKAESGQFHAIGDNCDGKPESEILG